MIWKTSITNVEPNHIVTRGFRQEDLIGNVPFTSIVYLLLKGIMPSEEEGRMMDAIITSCIDHGATPPTCLAARTVASAGVPLPTAVAAGLLAIGDVHGGAIENCAKLLQENVKRANEERKSVEETASLIVREVARIPGLGHRIHTEDPRTKRLFELAKELKISGVHIALISAIQNKLADARHSVKKKPLPINVDGAIAATISDMGFDWRLGKAFFLLGRAAGLVAHVYEEMVREKPMRRLCKIETEYDGPWERDISI